MTKIEVNYNFLIAKMPEHNKGCQWEIFEKWMQIIQAVTSKPFKKKNIFRFLFLIVWLWSARPVIADCPDDVTGLISQPDDSVRITWTEPSLLETGVCASFEFLGPGTNGGNYTIGNWTQSYQATGYYGNTTCSFTIIVALGNNLDWKIIMRLIITRIRRRWYSFICFVCFYVW